MKVKVLHATAPNDLPMSSASQLSSIDYNNLEILAQNDKPAKVLNCYKKQWLKGFLRSDKNSYHDLAYV